MVTFNHHEVAIISSAMKIFISILSTVLLVVSCANPGNSVNIPGPVNPVQGLKFGSQTWMAKNLDVVTFRNGDSIPQAISDEAWEAAGKQEIPAWCYYNSDSTTKEQYGRMYNWYAVNDPRGLAPQDWHIPSNLEWIALEEFVGSPDAGSRLKCDSASGNTHDDNIPDFCAMLGGYRDRNGRFTGIGEFTYLSGITQDTLLNLKEDERYFIWGRGLHVSNNTIMRCGLDKKFGLYVRCIKD